MSRYSSPSQHATIDAAEFRAAALDGFEKLRPVGTSKSDPGPPARRTRRFLKGILKSAKPTSKTDTHPPGIQDQNDSLGATAKNINTQRAAAEQREAVLGVERIISSKKATRIKSWIIPSHARIPQRHDDDSTEVSDLCLGDCDDFLWVRLQDDIYKHMVKYECAPNKMEFMPTRELTRLLNISTLEKELRRYDLFLEKNPRLQFLRFGDAMDPSSGANTAGTRRVIIAAAEEIHGNINALQVGVATSATEHERASQSTKKGSHDKSYVKILAALILIDRPARIKLFIDEGICDADLPLLKRVNSQGTQQLRRKSNPDEPLRCFERWDLLSIERFEKYQWKFLAPSFKRGSGKEVCQEIFKQEEILPFTYYGKDFQTGGFGQVTKVKIHPDHHNFENDFAYKKCFAVKRLLSQKNIESNFKREVAVLRRHSNDLSHQHLISLLCTYKQDGVYHLVFPWAKTDLLTFWSSSSFIDRDKALRWLAEQCQGIAEGLSHIHHHSTHSGKSLLHKESKQGFEKMKLQVGSASQDGGKPCILLFGRHGDIKPENILWFPGPRMGWRRGRVKGILKLADFGVADFSTHDEKHDEFNAGRHQLTAQTPTYRSPENDFKDQRIGSSYDIWGLGCVYLEFIVWWFGGWSMVNRFAHERKADDLFWTKKSDLSEGVLKLDTFFEIKDNTATLKAAVSKIINTLENHRHSTGLTTGFLRMVKEDMLVAVGKDQMPGRKSAKQIAMLIDGLREGQGWITRHPSSPRPSTYLGSDSASI